MKVGFSVPFHTSKKYRPNGTQLGDKFLTSLHNSIVGNYKVYLIDNGSETLYDYKKFPKIPIQYTYVEDQTKSGITGAWNMGMRQAYNDGCDIIIATSDDVEFNATINNSNSFFTKLAKRNVTDYRD